MMFKFYIQLFILTIVLGFSSCTSSEDPIHVEAKPYKRVPYYDTLSTDFTVKYISKYYFAYDKVLITDPDSSDYWYNFSSSYRSVVGIDAPDKTTAEVGVKMLDNLLIKWYNKDFIKSHFPKSILIGKSVYTYSYNSTTQITTKVPVDLYSGAYFLLIKAQNYDTMSVNTRKSVALALNNILWTNIVKYRPFMTIGLPFYANGRSNSLAKYEGSYTDNSWTGGKIYDPNEFVTTKMMYQSGYITCKKEYGTYFNKPYISKVLLPNETDDLNSWITFVLTNTDSDIQALKTKYSLFGTTTTPSVFEVKFAQIVKAFADVGIDYKNIGYKPSL